MKAIFVGNTSWSMWHFRAHVMSAFKAQGWDITVVAPDDEHAAKIAAYGFNFVPLRNLDRKGLSAIKDLKLFFELLNIYLQEAPDLVFHYTIKPNIWGTLAVKIANIFSRRSVQTVAVVSGLGYTFIKRTWLTYFVSLLYKLAFLFSNKVLFLNKDDMEDFYRYRILSRDNGKAMLLQGEGIDTTYFRPVDLGSKQTSQSKIIFLFVGRLLLDKGILEYVAAARTIKQIHPQVEFQILGGIDHGNPAGISSDELSSWMDEGIISYLGTTDDVRPFFSRATTLVLPSYQEGASRVLMEALAMAKPIITTNVRGCREFVDNGKNGYIIPPKSSVELHQAFKKIINLSPDILDAFATHSLKKSSAYSAASTVSFYKDLTKLLIGNGT